jgi:hypothetical protein
VWRFIARQRPAEASPRDREERFGLLGDGMTDQGLFVSEPGRGTEVSAEFPLVSTTSALP